MSDRTPQYVTPELRREGRSVRKLLVAAGFEGPELHEQLIAWAHEVLQRREVRVAA